MASSLTLGSIARIGGAVLALVAAVTLPILNANLIIDWALTAQFGQGYTYTLKSVRPSFSGFTASNIELTWGDAPVVIRRVNVNTGFLGMLKASYANNYEVLDNVTIEFEDIRNSEGLRMTGNQLPVGGVSASPFDAEGCGDNSVWLPAELRDMGLTLGATNLTLTMATRGDDYTYSETLATEGLGSATLIRKGTYQQTRDYSWDDIQWLTEHWEFDDKGFIAARNSYCAKQAGISEGEFHARHMAAVARLMSSAGLSVSSEMSDMYAQFARTGGALLVDGQYGMKLTESNWADVPWGDQLSSLKGEMQRQEARVALSWTRVSEVPFKESDAEKTTFEIMLKEGYQFSGMTASRSDANAPSPTGSKDATVVGADGTRSSSAAVASETLVISAQAPPPSLAPEMIAIHEEEPEYITDFQQIGKLVGRRIRLERRARPALIAQVLSGDSKQLHVRVRQPGGYADIFVPRGEFIRARVF